jgi:hypothetical protein
MTLTCEGSSALTDSDRRLLLSASLQLLVRRLQYGIPVTPADLLSLTELCDDASGHHAGSDVLPGSR